MKEKIHKAVEVMKEGGIILYPTDTIWGIGCDATNEEAISRIYKLKKREESQSMLVLVENERMLQNIVDVSSLAWDLIDLSEKPIGVTARISVGFICFTIVNSTNLHSML